jgi:DMSO/TMAO reductase YedYZ molybdopterin-dependent catalytic subunit
MDRRKFVNLAAAGAAAFIQGKRRLVPIESPGPLHPLLSSSSSSDLTFAKPAPAGARTNKLIIPTDTPDRFKAKVMEFNPVPAIDPDTWELQVRGMVERPLKLRVTDVNRMPRIKQSSRMKCVQCWSARIEWEGFRCGELLRHARPKPGATWVRFDCADMYYDYVKLEELLHPHTLFALAMNGEPLTPEHGAPLRLVMPFKYGYKSSKLITKITLTDHGGQGVVADTWPYYSQSGDIESGYDHPFDFPGQTRKIQGGEIIEY